MTETEPITTALVSIDGTQFGLPAEEAAHIADRFTPILARMTEAEPAYREIVGSEITPELSAKARRYRLAYVRLRGETGAAHKDAKAYHLAAGRLIDAWKNAQGAVSEAREARLAEIEEHFDRIERARVAALEAERQDQLTTYDVTIPGVGVMDDATWAAVLTGARVQYEARIEAARKAEADRIESERKAAEERAAEAARIEAERRAAIEREREARRVAEAEADALRKEREKAQAEARAREAEITRERAAAAAKAKAEREKAEAAIEAARAAGRAAQEKADAERKRLDDEARKQAAEIARLKAEQEAETERIRIEQERIDAAVKAQAEADAARSEADRFGDFLDELQEVLSSHEFEARAYRGVYSAIQQIVQQVVENGAQTRAAA